MPAAGATQAHSAVPGPVIGNVFAQERNSPPKNNLRMKGDENYDYKSCRKSNWCCNRYKI
jgi:hypothetical protein